MDEKELKNKSRYLSLLLRHKPEKENLTMDKNGWVSIDEILDKLGLELHELEKIVDENNKKRFTISGCYMRIRANQGHSIDVDVELKEVAPPHILYHGTGIKNFNLIKNSGIKRMNRQHVHLSNDMETAIDVGKRHGKPYVFKIMAKLMAFEGYKFYISENGVYLTDYIPKKYIQSDHE